MATSDGEPRRGTEVTARSVGEWAPATGLELIMLREQFTSSARGARLARRQAVRRMNEWGWPPESDTSCSVALVIGELSANAVHHGLVPGRDFHLHLGFAPDANLIRVEVSDASPDQPGTRPTLPSPDAESGRGLLLVDVLSTRWGATPRDPIGKTIWAEVAV